MRLSTGDVCFRFAMEGGYDLSIDVFRRPSHQRCLLPLSDGGRTRRSGTVIIYVFRRPSTAMLASAVRWREDTGDSWCVKVLLPATSTVLLSDGAGAMKHCLTG